MRGDGWAPEMIRRLFIATAASMACAACATTSDAPVAALPGQVEPVHAAAVAGDLAVFWVSSNGCTRKEDLIPIVSLQGGNAVITLRRIDEDKCRDSRAEGVELKWSFEELGLKPGSPVSVNNPYQLPQT